MTSTNPNAARTFRRLHETGLLVLPNAWDAGSARLVESLGAKAIATSSAAVAWSHGFADGNVLPVPILAAAVAEIVRRVGVPVSVDVEGGYSEDPAGAAATAATVIDAGGVGINIEDGAGTPDLLCAKIEQVRAAASRLGADLFVNARTDVYLKALVPPERRLDETVARAKLYREAGADGIFVPAVISAAAIHAIASAVELPLNVLARPDLPAGSELEALGVRRLSAGSWLASAAFGRIASLAADFLRTGSSDSLAEGAMPYGEINELMAPSARG
jgi:2-methylisocitrate lyase-like PEP mutase family enzyme